MTEHRRQTKTDKNVFFFFTFLFLFTPVASRREHTRNISMEKTKLSTNEGKHRYIHASLHSCGHEGRYSYTVLIVNVTRPVFDCKLQTLGGGQQTVKCFRLTVGVVEMSSIKWIW